VRKFLALIATPLVILAGCGGGGTSSNSPPPPPPPPPPPQVIATPGPPNVESLTVDQGPGALTSPATNTAFIKVTVCIPTTSTCQTIDHIEVDTGSSGLRIVAGASIVDAAGNPAGTFSLALPPVMDPNPKNPSNVLAECLQFADGFSWGSVNRADIKLPVSGETATGVVVQMIGAASAGDPAKASPTCVPPAPLNANACMGLENTVPCFGANGILGVGPFVNDCSSTSTCDPGNPIPNGGSPYPSNSATYFSCTAAPSCAQVAPGTVTTQLQLPNPAVRFAKDNNGVIIELPAVGANGEAAPWNGSLVFGIGTESNNGLGSATKLLMCPGNTTQGNCGITVAGMLVPLAGTITATLNGSRYIESYLDSGSNANFFPTTSIPSCKAPNAGFLCPVTSSGSPTTISESATLTGTDGTNVTADFSVANGDSLFSQNNSMNFAFSNLGGSNYSSSLPNNTVDLGLSYFYGRNVFTAFENNSAGPYFAY
jgi:hypothetical protein